jgi:hypothetical protein
MNCKPKQLAWIKVPKALSRGGVEQLHNRVVETQSLVSNVAEPTWTVKPDQVIQVTVPIRDAGGTHAMPGQNYEVFGIPDGWLVPLRGNPEPTTVLALPVLEQTV